MKKMLLVLALLVAVVAAVPWVAGVWVEQELRDKLQWEPDSATPDVNVVWEEYQRGYLNSTAKLRFDMGGVVHHYLLKIHHAPLLQTDTDIARITISYLDDALPDGEVCIDWQRQLFWKQSLPEFREGNVYFAGGEIAGSGKEADFPLNSQWRANLGKFSDDFITIAPTNFDIWLRRNGLVANSETTDITSKLGNINARGASFSWGFVEIRKRPVLAHMSLSFDSLKLSTKENDKIETVLDWDSSHSNFGLTQTGDSYSLEVEQSQYFNIPEKNMAEVQRLFALTPNYFSLKFDAGGFTEDTAYAVTFPLERMMADVRTNAQPGTSVNANMAFASAGLGLYQDLLMRGLSLYSMVQFKGGDGKKIYAEISLFEQFENQKELNEVKDNPLAIFRYLKRSFLNLRIDREWLTRGAVADFLTPEKLEKAGFVTDENGYILNLAVQDDGLALNGKLLTEEEIRAIPAMLQSLIPDHEL